MKSIHFVTSARVFAAAAVLFTSLSALPIRAQDATVAAPTVPIKVRSGDASPIAPVAGSKQFKLAISLPLRDEAGLDALLADIYNPQSPNFHHYLSPEEFTERYSPSQADYDAVVQWAQSKGLQVTRTTPNRRLIDVAGSADVIRRAFNVGLNDYRDNITSAVFHAPDREPTVDSPVGLLGVSGLDNALPPRPHVRKGDNLISTSSTIVESANAIAHISGSGPGNTYLPSDMRAAYYGNGPLTGAGQTVAIFSYDGYITNDINVYYSSTGMTSTVPVHNILVNGYNGACFGFNANGTINPNICDDGEQILDIVNVIGMAPGLTQVLFYEGDSSTDVLNQMATDNIAKVVSSSWGGGDFGTVSDPIFKQFQAQGISYLNATGDSGQFNSSTYFPPSVDANITQVGGTDLTTTGSGGPWASEVGWPDSGGGFFTGTAIPTYQQLAGVINSSNKGSTTLRNAPDVAAEANFDNTTVINGVFKSGYGGTSFATPRWAGLIALANQQSIANGHGTMGFLNPAIYNIGVGANFTANFHDITVGNNRPTAGSGTGFNAVTGYDLVTGWGSPVGPALIATLTGVAPVPNFSLTASPSSLTVSQGASGGSTITVVPVNGFAGSVDLSASGLPAGVTASFSPASTTGTSTLTLTASSTATVGATTVTITGTSGALTSTTTISLTVSGPTSYTLTATPSSLSVPKGSFAVSTISVNGLNGFSGTVTMSASNLPTGVVATFNPKTATTKFTSQLKLTATSTSTPGTYPVTITGTSGTMSASTTVMFTITSTTPGYTLTASPNSLSVVQSASGGSTITVVPTNGFTGSVALSASGLPAGVTASFSPASTTTSSALTLTASSTAALGPATVTITGTSGTLTTTTTIALTVTAPPSYTLTASPSTLSVVQGAGGGSTITVVPANGFTGSVALSASGLPTGVTASFSPASTTTSSALTLTASSTATLGAATVTITGTSGTLTTTTTIALTVTAAPSYTLTASPSSLSVVQSASGGSTITVVPANGFTGSVTLSASGLPAGVTASFSPASTTSTSTLTLTASSTATPGPAMVTVTGTSGALTTTTTVALTVTASPSYTLTASPSSLSVVQSASGGSTITVVPANGFTGSVALSASGLPAGVTASFSPASTTSTSTLTLTASSTATPGTAMVTVTGTSGALTTTTTIALTVTAAPSYTLTASPNSLSVAQSTSGGSTITVVPANGFTGSVALSASGLPAGVTASFSPASTTSTSTLTLTASSTATVGSTIVTVTGTSGALTTTTMIALTITTGTIPPVQLIGNPGFETGVATPWSMSAGTLCNATICSGESANSGTWFARFDGYGTSHTDTVRQKITIPSGSTLATLSFFLHIDTAETTTTRLNDVFTVQVTNTAGAVLATLAKYSNLNAAPGFVQQTFDMTPYIGQTVSIVFVGSENASLATTFVLDDVNVTVQ